MSNNPFGNMSAEGLEQGGDQLGGGNPFLSGLYDGVIKLAYSGESTGGAKSMTFVIATDDREFKETIYVTSGKEKGQKPYYEKDGKKNPLPGFTTANDLALLSTGKGLFEQTFEEKVVKLYDFEARKEVPTKVMAAVSMMDLPIKIGIVQTRKNKQKKNEQTNQYEDTKEERLESNIDKVFHAETNKTVSEFTAKIEEAEFQTKWVEKNTGQVRDKYNKVEEGGKSGLPGGASSSGNSGGKSLFA